MENVHTLTIYVGSSQAPSLMRTFERYGLVRTRLLAATRLFHSSIGSNRDLYDGALHRLRTLRISGDAVVAALIVHRDVREVIINSELKYEQFSDFCCRVDSSAYGSNITLLSMCLAPDLNIRGVLDGLAEVLPNLRDLVIEQRGCDPMVCSQTVCRSVGPDRLFPCLLNLIINRGFVWHLAQSLDQERVESRMQNFLEDLPVTSVLRSIRIGPTVWNLDLATYRWQNGQPARGS
ncbi:hypothetical protein B0H11DRAFT_1912380 [Mycena galericulata]|nr:hypothetical protein B0H11DRAFT_1912380 [Mycena galericulata]